MDIPLRFRGITLQEALDIAYESNNEVTDIYIQPPDCQDLTDEDSGDEDEGGTVENLSSRQLLAPAEVVFSNGTRVEDTSEDLANEQLPTVVQSDAKANSELTIVTKSEKSEFIETDLVYPNYPFPTPNYSSYQSLSSVQLFELFFTEELIQEIIQEIQEIIYFSKIYRI
ncbi:uncharacterized protein [Diabrotica undecimpunctata]|uniref:uncharacterized protein n=1 Tax=Diabrotica undecimpunctata TaxID=50387 RepID=UPI003B6329C2